jgi:hypothetical protein
LLHKSLQRRILFVGDLVTRGNATGDLAADIINVIRILVPDHLLVLVVHERRQDSGEVDNFSHSNG